MTPQQFIQTLGAVTASQQLLRAKRFALLALAVQLPLALSAQGLTSISGFRASSEVDPFASKDILEVASASSPVASIPGASATVTVGCYNTEPSALVDALVQLAGKTPQPSEAVLGVKITVAGVDLDVVTAANIRTNYNFIGPSTSYSTLVRSVTVKVRFDNDETLQKEPATAARFPSIDGKVWYRTGDLVVMDELGSLHHLDRTDNQVKALGHRIELGEVESHLIDLWHGRVAAVAWPVEHGSARGIAAFHCMEGLSAQEIRNKMMLRVPRYMIPQQVRRLETITLTEQGKIDRMALRAMLEVAADTQAKRGGPPTSGRPISPL
jgi:acyl-CoA synthetase (AMP-forming)/AMP-acid ligase II